VLSVSWTTIRLFLHVLGAAVWVGGQITMVKLVPAIRGLDPEGPRIVARRFNVVAWAAFALLVVTGVWSLLVIDVGAQTTAWHASLGLKLLLVAASGIGAAFHAGARSTVVLAVGGAVALLAGLGAVLIGLQLSGAT
jgi:putative copper export protein